MSDCFIWLVVVQIIIILVIVVVKIINKKSDEKTIMQVLDYIEKRANEKNNNTDFQECIKIMKDNQQEVNK